MQEADRVDALYCFQNLPSQPQGGADGEGSPDHAPPQVGQVTTLREPTLDMSFQGRTFDLSLAQTDRDLMAGHKHRLIPNVRDHKTLKIKTLNLFINYYLLVILWWQHIVTSKKETVVIPTCVKWTGFLIIYSHKICDDDFGIRFSCVRSKHRVILHLCGAQHAAVVPEFSH